jgi:hypothetical protein
MNKIARWLVILLLVMAMPLRGYAASAMVACGEAHGSKATSSHVHADGQEHRHVSSDAHPAAHDHPAHEHASSHGQAQADSPASSTHGASACSACGACCLGLGLTAATHSAEEPAAGSPAIPFRSRNFQGVVLEVFDPPPLALA